MAKKIFITGSADGLGLLTAQALSVQGHTVWLHARNEQRAKEAREKLPSAAGVFIADLSSMDQTKMLADQLNANGVFDVIIHNAAVYQAHALDILLINTLAPFILTSLVNRPKRLIYLSSDMHQQGRFRDSSFKLERPEISYSDSKLHMLMLAKFAGRQWSEVISDAINPGWVPTRMGGEGAPDSLESGYATQVWLAG